MTVTKDWHEIATLSPGAFFGEKALLEAEPRNATVAAKSDVRVLSISQEGFLEHLG